MDVNRLNTGEKLAGAAGIALLLIMFIFDWFTVDVGGGFADISVGGNAWETMELIRFILLLAAFAGIALAIAAASQTPGRPANRAQRHHRRPRHPRRGPGDLPDHQPARRRCR